MKPVRLADSIVIGQPRDWNTERDGVCLGLPCQVGRDDLGPFFMSTWTFSDVERETLAKDGKLSLVIRAPQHPVLQIGVINEKGFFVDVLQAAD